MEVVKYKVMNTTKVLGTMETLNEYLDQKLECCVLVEDPI